MKKRKARRRKRKERDEMGRKMKSKDWPQGRENLRVKGRKEKVVEGKREKAKEKERKQWERGKEAVQYDRSKRNQ